MAELGHLALDENGGAGNGGNGCEQQHGKFWYGVQKVALGIVVMDVNGDIGNAGAGCKQQCWKCLKIHSGYFGNSRLIHGLQVTANANISPSLPIGHSVDVYSIDASNQLGVCYKMVLQ